MRDEYFKAVQDTSTKIQGEAEMQLAKHIKVNEKSL